MITDATEKVTIEEALPMNMTAIALAASLATSTTSLDFKVLLSHSSPISCFPPSSSACAMILCLGKSYLKRPAPAYVFLSCSSRWDEHENNIVRHDEMNTPILDAGPPTLKSLRVPTEELDVSETGECSIQERDF